MLRGSLSPLSPAPPCSPSLSPSLFLCLGLSLKWDFRATWNGTMKQPCSLKTLSDKVMGGFYLIKREPEREFPEETCQVASYNNLHVLLAVLSVFGGSRRKISHCAHWTEGIYVASVLPPDYPRPPFRNVPAQRVWGGLEALRLERQMSKRELSMIAPTLLTHYLLAILREGQTDVISPGLKNHTDSLIHQTTNDHTANHNF